MKIELTDEEANRVVSVLRSLHGGALLDDIATKISDQIHGLVDWDAEAIKRQAKREGAKDLAPGVRVQIGDSVSPAYVRRARGTVMSFPTDTVHQRTKVKLDPEYISPRVARFVRPDGTISFPASALIITDDNVRSVLGGK